MITIDCHNDLCQLNSEDDRHHRVLYAQMAVDVPGARFSRKFQMGWWDGKLRFYRKTAEFDTGLLGWVLQILAEHFPTVKIEVKDRRTKPTGKSITMTDVVLRNYQEEAVDACIRATRGVLSAATGSGKTQIAIAIVAKLGLNTLFLVDSVDLARQTADRFAKHLPAAKIGVIYAGAYKAVTKTKGPDVVISTFHTLARKPELTKSLHFDVVMSDECHGVAAETWYKVMGSFPNTYYKFGLSGSIDAVYEDPIRFRKIQAQSGKVLVEIPVDYLVEQDVLAKPEIYMIGFPHRIYHKMTYFDEYEAAIQNNTGLNHRLVPRLVKKYAGKSILILVNRVSHGQELSEILGAPFVSGHDESDVRYDALQEFRDGNLKVLIASKIFRQGVDIPNIEVLINLGNDDSYKAVVQKLGRGLRRTTEKDSLIYLDVYPQTSGYCEKHAKNRAKKYAYMGLHVKHSTVPESLIKPMSAKIG